MRAQPRARRQGVVLAALAASALGLLSACQPSAPQAGGPGGLLWVAIDTLRADALGSAGGGRTPHLDRLADSGLMFERAISSAPWTLPSFASQFTGTVTSTHGCWTFESRLGEDFVTLAELFEEAGFATAGVASHVFFDAKHGLTQGFQEFDDDLCVSFGRQRWREVTSPEVAGRAIESLETLAADGRPWFLFAHFFDPHEPYVIHPGSGVPQTATERQRYAGEVTFTDRHVGRVLDRLEDLNLHEDTVVLLTSDHGEAFGEHPGVRRHGTSLYNEEIRVPLLLRIPGFDPRRIGQVVRTIDVFPTLVELFDLDGPPGLPGQSLLEFASGDSGRPRDALSEVRLREGRHFESLTAGQAKWIRSLNGGTDQLFDLAEDPGEQLNLVQSSDQRALEWTARLDRTTALARELAGRFGIAGSVEHTPEELEHLRTMGYVDED